MEAASILFNLPFWRRKSGVGFNWKLRAESPDILPASSGLGRSFKNRRLELDVPNGSFIV
jgi:hypothetical protein